MKETQKLSIVLELRWVMDHQMDSRRDNGEIGIRTLV